MFLEGSALSTAVQVADRLLLHYGLFLFTMTRPSFLENSLDLIWKKWQAHWGIGLFLLTTLLVALGLALGFGKVEKSAISASPAQLDIRGVKGEAWQDVFKSIVPTTSAKEMALVEIPAIKNPSLTDAQRVEMLRHWVAGLVDVDQTRKLDCASDITCQSLFNAATANVLIMGFRQDRLAVMCGFAATTLGKVLTEFGYRTIFVNMGMPKGGTSHYVPLVELERGGKKIWSIQDPYYDTSFQRRDGQLIDYFEMVTLLQQRRHGEVIPTNPKGVYRQKYEIRPQTADIVMTQWVDGFFRLLSDLSVKTYSEEMGCPPEAIYLYLKPFAFYNLTPTESEAFLNRVHQIVGDTPCLGS